MNVFGMINLFGLIFEYFGGLLEEREHKARYRERKLKEEQENFISTEQNIIPPGKPFESYIPYPKYSIYTGSPTLTGCLIKEETND